MINFKKFDNYNFFLINFRIIRFQGYCYLLLKVFRLYVGNNMQYAINLKKFFQGRFF